MHFDTITLIMAGSITTAISGVLLIGIWTQMRHATALVWWFAAYMLYAAGIALLAGGLPTGAGRQIAAGSLLSDLAAPLMWIGIRVFGRQRPPGVATLLAVAAWLAVDVAVTILSLQASIGFAGWIIWLSASAFELWRGRAERIPARWPLMGVLLIHAFVFAGGVFDTLTGRMGSAGIAPLGSWFGAIFFEGMFYAIASSILMALLCKERETQEYMRAARSDSLTGIANHGALLESARRLFERCRKDGTPCSLIMFDLDHFKDINDRHGHRSGDAILRAFTEAVRALIRPTDLFGRYGGEEFSLVLPGATLRTAQVIAERVRHTFAQRHRFLDGQPLNATVSAGVAEAGPDMPFEALFDAADRATYRAKDLGRNRVELADHPGPVDPDAVVRIA